MPAYKATAIAYSNIALIKYWGNRDNALRLPVNGSLSMNLGGLETHTTVEFIPSWSDDEVIIGDTLQTGAARDRVIHQLELIRERASFALKARVESRNNFPTGAGIASSASAFAALTLAGSAAAGLHLSEAELSIIARRGSGSASRSIPSGFVEWQMGDSSETSYAFSVAPPSHWDLCDVIAVISQKHKAIGSTGGHAIANTSPLQAARVASVAERLNICRAALLARDFLTLAEVVEADSNIMHSVMMTSVPPLFYWEPITIAIMKAVRRWRSEGMPVCYTIDAGPNVHCLCPMDTAPEVERRLRENLDVRQILKATPGGPARLVG